MTKAEIISNAESLNTDKQFWYDHTKYYALKDELIDFPKLESILGHLDKDDFKEKFETLDEVEKEIFLSGVIFSNINISKNEVRKNLITQSDLLKKFKFEMVLIWITFTKIMIFKLVKKQ